jgi:hypothetical protein
MPTLRTLLRLAALALGLGAAPLHAQGLRTLDLARQLRDDTRPLQVLVDYDVGKITVHGTEERLLYQVQLAYDPRRAEPLHRYDSTSRLLQVGLRKGRSSGAERETTPELRLDLARTVPTDLRLDMGAAEADLDLGGMRLVRLAVESGASDAMLHFDAPNAIPMQLLVLDVGAASLRARRLGNARARELRVSVGIGSAELDFTGEWTGEMNLDLQVALGHTSLRVPDDVGVRVDLRRFLASFDREGFVKRADDMYYSANYDSAARKLHVRGRTVLGELELTRVTN